MNPMKAISICALLLLQIAAQGQLKNKLGSVTMIDMMNEPIILKKI
jgi:hypothetical protein